jgi:hypothetical protein
MIIYINRIVLNTILLQMIDPTTIFPLYRISYQLIAPLGVCTTLTIGIIASALTYKHGSINEYVFLN